MKHHSDHTARRAALTALAVIVGVIGLAALAGARAYAQGKTSLISSLNVDGFNKKPQAEEIYDHNPFIKPVDAFAITDLVLAGIIYSPQRKAALVNGVILKEGDTIGRNEVLRIERRRVVLKNVDGIFSLTLRGRAQ